jgi:hypothetical protein
MTTGPEAIDMTARPRRRISRRVWTVAVVGLAVVIVAAIFALGVFSPKHMVMGSFSILPSDDNTSNYTGSRDGGCQALGGYSDVKEGVPVTLKDGEGRLLGTSTLGSGTLGNTPDSPDQRACVFGFSFSDIPQVPFYTVEIGRRGEVSYSLADLQARSWTISVKLGP